MKSRLRGILIIAVFTACSCRPAANAQETDQLPGQQEIIATVVDSAGHSVPGAVVFIYSLKGKVFPPPAQPATMDQINKELEPHVLPVLVGTQVIFPNKDNIHHQLYSFSSAKKFELPLYKGKPAAPIAFDKPGIVKLGCNIHDWMSGIILVLPNPYFAKTDASGKASLIVRGDPATQIAVFHDRLLGSVDDTVRTLHFVDHRAEISWKLSLKMEEKRSHDTIPENY